MRILLTMNLPYYPALGGANKGLKATVEAFARKGHIVAAVVPTLATPSRITYEEFLQGLAAQGVELSSTADADIFTMGRVTVHAVREPSRLRARLVDVARSFQPDWVIVSSENPSQNLLDAALNSIDARVAYVVQATTYLPFGPDSFYPSSRIAGLLEGADLIVGASQFLVDYLRRWGNLDAMRMYIPLYGSGPFPSLGRFEEGFVTIVNPCLLKGMTIFTELARRMPDVEFAAVPTWGTTKEDIRTLESLPNVRLLPPDDDFEKILAQTRVLLMPSVVPEGFGATVVETLLRAIPVVASNAGGLREATVGAGVVIPVRPIELYTERLDGNELPVPVVPEQEIGPWEEAVRSLLSDRSAYERASALSRAAAARFVSELGIDEFEKRMLELKEKPLKERPRAGRASSQGQEAARRSAGNDKRADGLAGLSPEQRALLIMKLKKRKEGNGSRQPQVPPIKRAPRDANLPASFAQQRLWFLDQLNPGSPLYNQPVALLLRGDLDKPVLERVMAEVIRRHEVLRTTFADVDGQPVQVIGEAGPVAIPVTDLSALPEEERQARARELAVEEAQKPFDLAEGPLVRASLLRMGEQEHVALFTTHHAICDGWSVNVLIREITTLYQAFVAGEESPLPELPIQYADFACWQREWLSGDVLAAELAFWREQLGGAPPLLELPSDRPRPARPTFRGAQQLRSFPAELVESLKALGNKHHVTLFMTLLAAFKVLLFKLSGQDDIVVGTSLAGRNRIETEPLIGFFINTLALRTRLAGDPTFAEVLKSVRQTTLDAYAHQDLPFEKLVEELRPSRSTNYTPLFQVLFSLNNVPESTLELSDLAVSSLNVNHDSSKFDLALYAEERGRELLTVMEFNTDLFEPSTINRMLEQYQTLLENLARDPDQRVRGVALSSAEARLRMADDFSADFSHAF